jgi:hypothetical protein
VTNSRWWLALGALALLLAAWPVRAQTRVNYVLWDGDASDTTAVLNADSSSIVFTGFAQRMVLSLKPSRPCTIALMVTEHGDSIGASSAPGLADSSKTVVWPWKNAQGIDSLMVYRETLQPFFGQAANYEYVVVFPDINATASAHQGPRGRLIALKSPTTGEWYTGEHTRIRYRVLAAGGVVTMKGTLKCYGW